MNCLKKNCKINNDAERMITCWLCHNLCHYKCTGLPTLVNESVNTHDGLNWFCFNCRKPAVEFYRFFQGTKTRFCEIKKSALLLNDNISEYGKLFDDFASLDNLKSPPQSSPKRRKSARNIAKDKENLPDTPCPLDGSTPATPITTIITPSSPIDEIPPAVQFISNNNNDNPLYNMFNGPSTSGRTNSISASTSTTPYLNLNEVRPEPKQLVVVPPRKSIFVSRFAFETSAEDINHYIKNKINIDNADISINKFKYSTQRNITSFKITVSPDLFGRIVDPAFWPQNAIVREYIFREYPRTNVARLPQNLNSASKN